MASILLRSARPKRFTSWSLRKVSWTRVYPETDRKP